MSKYALNLMGLLAISSLAAVGCSSGGGGGGGNNTPDAAVIVSPDASPTQNPDAMVANYSGLDEQCQDPSTCPTFPSAAQCLGPQGSSVGFCTFECATDESVTTDANGKIALSAIPQADHTKCSDFYTGDGGVAVCGVLTAESPMNPGANTSVTISASCAIFCDTQSGGKVCPDGTTCQGSYCLE